jgi:AhpD family alkylhydroperoxidase
MTARPPILSGHALRSLARAVARWPSAKGRGVDRVLRERVILHVSAVNTCSVCTAVHVRSARRIGMEEGDIEEACALDLGARDERTRTALRYAEVRTLDVEAEHPEEVARFEAEFTPEEQRALRATVDLFTFNNRFNNTWTRILRPATRRVG